MEDTVKENLLTTYNSTFFEGKKPTPKEYVTLEQENSNNHAEFAIYGNRLVHFLTKKIEMFSYELISKGNILEIGCGIGRLLKPLSVHFKWATGVDISADILNEAKKYLRDTPNISLYENDGQSLKVFEDNTFEYVLTAGVIQHIPNRIVIESYLQEAIRVLKYNGLFLFVFQIWQSEIEGQKRVGAKISSSWLEKVFENLPIEFLEASLDPDDPVPHLSILVRKTKNKRFIMLQPDDVSSMPLRTLCWDDLSSMKSHQEMQKKGQRRITFFDPD